MGKSISSNRATEAPRLPSGYLCEAISSGNQHPLKKLTCSLVEGDKWPYKIEIIWGCFIRRYRYTTRESFEVDRRVLLGLCNESTTITDIS